MTEFLSTGAIHIMIALGYTGLFVLSAIESCGIPIPSEIILPFAGFLVASGQFGLWTAAAIATVGNFVGSVGLYYIGYSGGRWILERYGKYVLIHRRDIEVGEAWFKRHGVKAIFYGRVLPIVRTFISLPAGVAKMSFKKFSAYSILGAFPWNLALIYVGYKAGEHWDSFKPYFHIVDYVILALVVLFIIRHLMKKSHQGHG